MCTKLDPRYWQGQRFTEITHDFPEIGPVTFVLFGDSQWWNCSLKFGKVLGPTEIPGGEKKYDIQVCYTPVACYQQDCWFSFILKRLSKGRTVIAFSPKTVSWDGGWFAPLVDTRYLFASEVIIPVGGEVRVGFINEQDSQPVRPDDPHLFWSQVQCVLQVPNGICPRRLMILTQIGLWFQG